MTSNKILEATAGTGINQSTPTVSCSRARLSGVAQAQPPGRHHRRRLAGPAARLHRVPRPIVMTSNCLIEPQPAYRNRIFTLGPVGWPGIRHLDTDDLSLLVKAAESLPGFTEDVPAETVTTGFAHGAVLSVADRSRPSRPATSRGSCSSAAATVRPRRNY